jgi:hypothetical protein
LFRAGSRGLECRGVGGPETLLGFYFAKKKSQNKTIYCWAGSGADIAWIYFVEKKKKNRQNKTIIVGSTVV